jgi:hypothetical protein
MRWWHNASNQFPVISHQKALARNGEGFFLDFSFRSLYKMENQNVEGKNEY